MVTRRKLVTANAGASGALLAAGPARSQKLIHPKNQELPREMLDRMEREYPELLEPRWGEFERPIPFKI